jgi:hypothetical protein
VVYHSHLPRRNELQARPLFKDRRKFPKMADPLLQGRYPMRGLYQALAVAAMCLQEQAATRPLIGDVVTALSYLASQTYETGVVPLNSSRIDPQPVRDKDEKSSSRREDQDEMAHNRCENTHGGFRSLSQNSSDFATRKLYGNAQAQDLKLQRVKDGNREGSMAWMIQRDKKSKGTALVTLEKQEVRKISIKTVNMLLLQLKNGVKTGERRQE